MRNARILFALCVLAATLAACESNGGDGGAPFTCTDGVSDFQACGGDPAGEWVFQEACMDFAAQWAGNEMMAACPEAKVSGTLTWVGSATFADGVGTIRMQGGTASTHLEIPTSCLQDAACEGVVPGFACATSGEACVCDESGQMEAQPDSVTAYRVEGTDLVVTEDGGGETRTPVCVRGDWATVALRIGADTGNPADAVPLYLTMKRK